MIRVILQLRGPGCSVSRVNHYGPLADLFVLYRSSSPTLSSILSSTV